MRYHLAGVPTTTELGDWSLKVGGEAGERNSPSVLDDLHKNFEQVEVVAVCQCSGNRRGLSSPHVAGVQWAYGAMGSATWSGPRLKDVLAKVGVKAGAVEVWLDGADGPVLPTTPDFHKSLPMDKAMADETIIATTMNGQQLPHLNGYPARIVVPGWTATYWMKHIVSIRLGTRPLDSFWMQKAYRVPAGMFLVDHPFPTQDNQTSWPITDIVVNSVIAGPVEGTRLTNGGIHRARCGMGPWSWDQAGRLSLDGGKTWQEASLRKDLGRFAFRAFTLPTGRLPAGDYVISSRATNNAGETQVGKLKFNPAGYHNNVPQQLP